MSRQRQGHKPQRRDSPAKPQQRDRRRRQFHNSTPTQSTPACSHSPEREMLKEVYQQVFTIMRRRAELERRNVDLAHELDALRHELSAAHEREDEAKVRLLEGRRAERRYQQILLNLVEVADDYRLSLDLITEGIASLPGNLPTDGNEVRRLHRLVQAPLERLDETLSSLGISVRHAEPDRYIDLRHFDVAAAVEDAECVPGTVVKSHRPAYVGQDGAIIRKGAAIVTRRREETFDESDSSRS